MTILELNFRIEVKGSEIMSFQENLRYYREKAGYKQAKDFAKVLDVPIQRMLVMRVKVVNLNIIHYVK